METTLEKQVKKEDVLFLAELKEEDNNLKEIKIQKYIFMIPKYYNNVHFIIKLNTEKAVLIEASDNWYGSGVKLFKETTNKRIIQKLMKIANEYAQKLSDNDNNNFDILKQMFNSLFEILDKVKND